MIYLLTFDLLEIDNKLIEFNLLFCSLQVITILFSETYFNIFGKIIVSKY